MEMLSQENGEMMYGLGITKFNRGLDFFNDIDGLVA